MRSRLVFLAFVGALALGVSAAEATQPKLIVPSAVVVEATGPDGAVVTFDVQAQNPGGTADVVCDPASGSVFALGTTKVVCTATDPADSSSATASFPVVVRDKTGPDFEPPPSDVTESIDAATSTKVDYVEPVAHDLVDGDVDATCTPAPGALFPLGNTTVTCRAKDSHGNTTAVTFTVDVVDDTPPPPVAGLKTALLGIGVSLAWEAPSSSDVVRVELTRRPGLGGAAESMLYHGTAHTFLDRTVRAGTTYKYALVAVDRVGNQSSRALRTVAVPAPAPKKPAAPEKPEAQAQPKPAVPSLFSPANGARITSPPLLRWRAVAGAAYYNVQIYRAGIKLLSTWPRTNQLRLQAQWLYNGHTFQLKPGTYQWYVWPGFGPLANAKYGKRLLQATFIVRQP
jgi:hypothetical protein